LSGFGEAPECLAHGDVGALLGKTCLLRFQPLPPLPPFDNVTSATIQLQILDASAGWYNLYVVRRNWVEAQADWTNYSSGTPWQTPGGKGSLDRAPSFQSFMASSTGTFTLILNGPGRSAVQAWMNNPTTNQGLMIASDTETDGLAVASSEHVTASFRPVLTVTHGQAGTAGGGGSGGGDGSGGSAGRGP
jgi:hypothetical protein